MEYAGLGQDERELKDKIAELLAAGTRQVWVVRLIGPQRVEVHRPDGPMRVYTASDVLRGSGLSSSAAFEMGMAVILNGEYGCGLPTPELAKICQYAENTYFGKPSGLLDQLTSAVGGVIFADFADPAQPDIEKRTMSVTYNSEKLGIKNVEHLIAGVGFDANSVPAKEDAKKNLPSACR